MAEVVARDPKVTYLESLRWRHDSLKQQLDAAQKQIEELNRKEAGLTLQLRAVEQLLAVEVAEESNGVEWQGSPLPAPDALEVGSPAAATPADNREDGNAPEDQGTIDWSIWGPKARRIYVAAAQALREAGVPLHYRVLADEVQKQVPLSGADAGATLIAHMHRAQEIFPRLGRGIYGLRGMTASDSPRKESAVIGRPAGRVRRTRRRRTQPVGGKSK
jgi:HB1, ASXL, restriction endonuclease HTH domain